MQPGISFTYAHPAALMYAACKESPAMGALMSATITKVAPNPLLILVYTDEVTPGNQLSFANARKTWAVYFTIADWGNAVCSDGDHTCLHVQCKVCAWCAVCT